MHHARMRALAHVTQVPRTVEHLHCCKVRVGWPWQHLRAAVLPRHALHQLRSWQDGVRVFNRAVCLAVIHACNIARTHRCYIIRARTLTQCSHSVTAHTSRTINPLCLESMAAATHHSHSVLAWPSLAFTNAIISRLSNCVSLCTLLCSDRYHSVSSQPPILIYPDLLTPPTC
jgi:hypothetical protein